MADGDKKTKKRMPEWLEYGDPRTAEGHFRPKRNLDEWLKQTEGWSQKRLAAEMETDEGTVSKWINGKVYLSDRKLVKIARVTGLSIPFLLDMQHCGGQDFDEDDELDSYDYWELDEDEDDPLGSWPDREEEDSPEWVWGRNYGPHEVEGFASDLLGEMETLWSERWRSERRGLPSRDDEYDEFVKALEVDWDPEKKYTVYTYLHFVGDIRDPWHLEEELHKGLMDLRPSKRAMVLDSLSEVMLGCAGAKTRDEMARGQGDQD